jgi:hypothetical protein
LPKGAASAAARRDTQAAAMPSAQRIREQLGWRLIPDNAFNRSC